MFEMLTINAIKLTLQFLIALAGTFNYGDSAGRTACLVSGANWLDYRPARINHAL
jgi:hypothetical protein